MPENLVESILFGHEKGAFTGATERHVGKFVEASGGTLFLDEVGELPAPAQVKLLRAIQEGEVEPVGARKPVKVDVRLVSATNRDLIADVKAGRFREDLFYRLHVFPITVPPLRERAADIPALTRHFLARFAAEEGKRIRMVSPEALRVLSAYHWPGNIRQLENAVFRAVVLADADAIGLDEFPQIAAQLGTAGLSLPRRHPRRIPRRHRWRRQRSSSRYRCRFPHLFPLGPTPAAPVLSPALPPPLPGDALPVLDAEGEVRPLEEVEADLIKYAITHYRGQMSEVARRLQIGRSTLYRKLEALGLNNERAKEMARPLRQSDSLRIRVNYPRRSQDKVQRLT